MNLALYLIVVLFWGTSWIVIILQVETMPPVLSVLYRFAVAATLMITWAALRGEKFRFSLREHGLLAILGLAMFSGNYVLFYEAAAFGLTTGLIAVIFSTSVIMNLINARIWLGHRADGRVVIAAMLGITGIVVVFWRDIRALGIDDANGLAIIYGIAGTYLFSLGNMVSTRLQSHRLPVVATSGIAMAYGAIALTVFAFAVGVPWRFDPSPAYIGSLAFLAVFTTVIGFASYLTLLGRIGAPRASYVTVIFPIIALGLSTLFEDYQWTPWALAGVVLILAGNVVVLTRPSRAVAAAPQIAA
ncbi:MAG: EamA family transporter [Alphaproteobacteria bacterium]|nr:EamA family transporter [Alphaproteobacteria bacterium]